jgi:integrase
MKGHIRQRSRGHWAIVLDVRDGSTGERKRRWHSFAGTKRAAQTECARLIAELKAGICLEPTKATASQFLDRWLDYVRSRVSAKSHERYVDLCRKNIGPLLGRVALTKLQPVQISDAYAKALASGHRKANRGLSPRTVHHLHRIFKQALKQAVRWQLIARNPADLVEPPKVERQALRTYDLAQTVELLTAMRETRMYIPTTLAVLCGLRRGEIAALRWRHVDLAGAAIAVVESVEETKAGVRCKETKTGRGRSVALSPTTVDALKAWRTKQAEELLRVGTRPNGDTFVVTQADGAPLRPRSLTHEWVRLLARTNLPRLRFHDLRHAHATHLLAAGVHPKVASERLGHSKVGITLDLYSHVMPGMQEDAVLKVEAALKAARGLS